MLKKTSGDGDGAREHDLEDHAGKVPVVVNDYAVSIPAVGVTVEAEEVSGRDLAAEARPRRNRRGPDRWGG